MSEKANQFVVYLSKSPEAQQLFMKDPDAAMDGYDLADEDREILRTKDPEKIREHLGSGSILCVWEPFPFLIPSQQKE